MDIRADVAIQIAPARPLPPDWDAWRQGLAGGAPLEEIHTVPHGWSVTLAESASVIHAFYSVLDRAVHARAVLPADAPAALRQHVRAAFTAATPVFASAIVALVDV